MKEDGRFSWVWVTAYAKALRCGVRKPPRVVAGFPWAEIWGRSPGQRLQQPGQNNLDFTCLSPVHWVPVFPVHISELFVLIQSRPGFSKGIQCQSKEGFPCQTRSTFKPKAWIVLWNSIRRKAEMGLEFEFQGCTLPCTWLSSGVSDFRQHN